MFATFHALALPQLAMMVAPVHAFALALLQALPSGSMDACVVYAPLIAVVVSLLKRVPFMAKYPKFIAATLSTFAVAFPLFATGGAVATAAVVSCVLKVFAGSIATYEIALKPLGKVTGVSAS